MNNRICGEISLSGSLKQRVRKSKPRNKGFQPFFNGLRMVLVHYLIIGFLFAQLLYGYTSAFEVCISFEENNCSFLNVKWNHRTVNLKGYGVQIEYHKAMKDDTKISTVLFPYRNVTNTSISLKGYVDLGDTLVVKVSIITKDFDIIGSSWIFQTVAHHLHKVVYNKIDERSVELICVMACMSPVIEGCAVTAKNLNSSLEIINGNSTNLKSNAGLNRNFKPLQVLVRLDGLRPFEQYDYSAVPLMKSKRYAAKSFSVADRTDGSHSENDQGSQSTSIVVTIAASVGGIIVIIASGLTILFWCCYKAARSKENFEANTMLEEDAVTGLVNEDAVLSDQAALELPTADHCNDQPLLQSTPIGNCEMPSIIISSNQHFVDENEDFSVQPLFSIEEDYTEEVFSDSPKPNRKFGVTTAVFDGQDVNIEEETLPAPEIKERRSWYRRIKPKADSRTSPRRSKMHLKHSTSSTASFRHRFNRLIGRSLSLSPHHTTSPSFFSRSQSLLPGQPPVTSTRIVSSSSLTGNKRMSRTQQTFSASNI